MIINPCEKNKSFIINDNYTVLIRSFRTEILISRQFKFRKFKVALSPMYRIFLNFAKSCVLSCLSNVDIIKRFHRAVFEL